MIMIKNNFQINLIELKIRSIYFLFNFFLFFLISFIYKAELLFLFSYLFLQHETGFIYTNLFEPLFVYLKLSFVVSLILSFPFLVYFLFFFFLKAFETFYLYCAFIYLLIFYIIFLCLFILEFFYIFPFIFEFLLSFQKFDLFNLILTITVTEYLNFFYTVFFVYLFLACLPSVFCIGILANFFNYNLFFNYKLRVTLYFLLTFIFLIIAPPDFILQCLLAPLFILVLEFFICFNICFLKIIWFYKKSYIQRDGVK